jgi:hypothetical protein
MGRAKGRNKPDTQTNSKPIVQRAAHGEEARRQVDRRVETTTWRSFVFPPTNLGRADLSARSNIRQPTQISPPREMIAAYAFKRALEAKRVGGRLEENIDRRMFASALAPVTGEEISRRDRSRSNGPWRRLEGAALDLGAASATDFIGLSNPRKRSVAGLPSPGAAASARSAPYESR